MLIRFSRRDMGARNVSLASGVRNLAYRWVSFDLDFLQSPTSWSPSSQMGTLASSTGTGRPSPFWWGSTFQANFLKVFQWHERLLHWVSLWQELVSQLEADEHSRSLRRNEVVIVAGEGQSSCQFVHFLFDFGYATFFDKVPLKELSSRYFEPQGQLGLSARRYLARYSLALLVCRSGQALLMCCP